MSSCLFNNLEKKNIYIVEEKKYNYKKQGDSNL